jgi:hypothetical protein
MMRLIRIKTLEALRNDAHVEHIFIHSRDVGASGTVSVYRDNSNSTSVHVGCIRNKNKYTIKNKIGTRLFGNLSLDLIYDFCIEGEFNE